MRLLLDEYVPKRLASALRGHEVCTVPQMGWSGIQNGDLIRRAAAEFNAFITVDRNISYQQNLSKIDIAVIALVAPSNDIEDLRPLIPGVLEVFHRVGPGEFVRVER